MDLGTVSYRIVADTSSLDGARADMQQMRGAADVAGSSAQKLGNDVTAAGKKVKTATGQMQEGFRGATSTMQLLTRAAAALGVSLGVRQIVSYSDAWNNAANQLRLVTSSSQDLANVQKALMGVANGTRASFESTAGLFTRLTKATHDMGLSQKELIGLTTTINQSFAVSGASADSMNAAITQLSQGLAAGALRGDEFNSVAEQAPGIMDAIAASLKMTRGELREFAAEGGITAEIVVTALKSASDAIAGDFAKAQMTFGQSLTVAKNNAIEFIGTNEGIQSAVAKSSELIIALSNNLEYADEVLTAVALVISARMVPALTAAAAQMLAGASAAGALGSALALVGGPGGALLLMVGGLAMLISRIETTTERTERLRESLNSLQADQIRQAISEMKIEEAAAEATIARMQARSRGYAAEEAAIARQQERLDEVQETIKQYGLRLSNLVNGIEDSADAADEAADATGALGGAMDDASEATATLIRKNADFVDSLRVELRQMNLTGRALEHDTALSKLNAAATDEIRQEVLRLVDAIFERNEATRQQTEFEKLAADAVAEHMEKQADAAEKLADAHREAAEASQREWMEFRNSFSDAFAGMLMDSENVFDAIAKSFERMLYKMAADLVASSVMNFLTGSGGGFDLGASLSGAGTSGQITKALLDKYLPGVMGKAGGSAGGAVISQAEYNQLMGGKSVNALTGLKDAALTMGAGIAGSYAGTAAGEAIFNKEAESAWGATIGGVIGSMWGPMGSFVGSAIGGLVDAAAGGDGKKRINAGFLSAPTPGADPEYLQGTHQFASGLKVNIFARRTDAGAANDIVKTFDQVDQSFTDLVKELGGNLQVSQLTGLDEEANPGSTGAFFGLGGNGTAQGDILAQINSFVSQLADNVTGLDEALLSSLQAATSAEEALSLLTLAVAEKAAQDERATQAEKAATQTATEKAAAAQQAIITERDIANERAGLIQQLNQLTMTNAQALEMQRSALHSSNRALFDSITEITTARAEAAAAVEAARAGLTAANESLQSAMSAVSSAMSAVTRAVQTERNAITKAYNDSTRAVTDSLGRIMSLSSALKSTLDGMSGVSRPQAQAQLAGALASARAGAGFPTIEQLRPALDALSEPSEGLFASFEDYQVDFIRTANDIAELAKLADTEKSAIELQIDAMEAGYDAEMARLDSVIAYAQAQVDALHGINASVIGLGAALAALGSSIGAAQSAQSVQAAAQAAVSAAVAAQTAANLPVAAQPYTQYSTADIRAYTDATGINSVTDLYAAAMAKNADPVAVGAAFGFSEAETLAMLKNAGLPGYAAGSNFIQSDQLAMVHRGEEIKPRPYVDRERAEREENTRLLAALLAQNERMTVELADIKRNSKRVADITEKTDAIGPLPAREPETT